MTPDGSTARHIKNSIACFITNSNIDVKHFVAIGCDGTNVNTGRVGGVVTLLEKEYGKPLQWLICMLHANEPAAILGRIDVRSTSIQRTDW